jgi:hypothetical protein
MPKHQALCYAQRGAVKLQLCNQPSNAVSQATLIDDR